MVNFFYELPGAPRVKSTRRYFCLNLAHNCYPALVCSCRVSPCRVPRRQRDEQFRGPAGPFTDLGISVLTPRLCGVRWHVVHATAGDMHRLINPWQCGPAVMCSRLGPDQWPVASHTHKRDVRHCIGSMPDPGDIPRLRIVPVAQCRSAACTPALSRHLYQAATCREGFSAPVSH
jgi:hypothetical protein